MNKDLEKIIKASELPVVEFMIDDNFIEELRISIVSSPAINKNFLLFSKEKEFTFKEANKEQRIVTGAAMIPNYLMGRIDKATGIEYRGFFSEKSIRNYFLNFLSLGDRKFNIEHSQEIFAGAKLLETYFLSEDLKNKKFSDYPNGTGMISLQLDEPTWNDYIKTGKVTGFSIEAFLDLIPVNFSVEPKSDAVILQEIKDLLKNY